MRSRCRLCSRLAPPRWPTSSFFPVVVYDCQAGPPKLGASDMDQPWLLTNFEPVAEWMANPRVQFALNNLATQYKKNTKQTGGRGQLPMFSADAKVETNELFGKVMALAGDSVMKSSATVVQTVMKNTWFYGNDPLEHFARSTRAALASSRSLQPVRRSSPSSTRRPA